MKINHEQIKKWKEKHGTVFLITVEDKQCYLKKPNRKVLSYAMSQSQTNPLAFAETILTNCWLGGDEAFKTDDAYFLALSSQLDTLIEVKQAELKKL